MVQAIILICTGGVNMEILKYGEWDYVKSNEMNGCIVIRYSGSDTTITVPAVIEGLPVKGVGVGMVMQAIGSVRMSFLSGVNIERVVFPESIEIIDDYAFLGCAMLKEVVLPKSLKVIGHGSFYACTALQSVDLPEGLEVIGTTAFSECVGLKSVAIPSTTKTVASLAFAFCKNLESVVIPDGVECLDIGAFMNTNLKAVDLPSSVKIAEDSSIGCFDIMVEICRSK
jgi:hypothetical protein